MTSAEYRDLHRKGPAKTSAAAAQGKTSPEPKERRSAAAIEAERVARLEVVKVGRAVGHHTGFGVVVPYRRYTLQNEEQAAALDAAFYSITGTEAPK